MSATYSKALAVFALALAVTRVAWSDPYPASLIDRPLTLPEGTFEVSGGVSHDERRALGIEILSAETLHLGVRWGVSRRWEVGLATGFRVSPDASWTRELAFAAAWRARSGGRLELAPSLAMPFSVHTGYDVVSVVEIGAGLRLRLGDRWFATAGRRLLRLDARPAIAAGLVLDAGAGIQLTPTLAFIAETQLAELTLVGQIDRTRTALDGLPLALRGLWAALPRVDAVVEVRAGDVTGPAGAFSVLVAIDVRN